LIASLTDPFEFAGPVADEIAAVLPPERLHKENFTTEIYLAKKRSIFLPQRAQRTQRLLG
jgi:hypothetical protein